MGSGAQRESPWWGVGQAVGLAGAGALVVGLLRVPEVTLRVLWSGVVPLIPATLLISPGIWRNVCPLATLNMMTNRPGVTRPLPPSLAHATGAVGVGLLVILVPARRFVFNTDAVSLAIVIVAVAALAMIMGSVLPLKAGFCNAICPVLPVERLYGQRPLVKVTNPRCQPCAGCTG